MTAELYVQREQPTRRPTALPVYEEGIPWQMRNEFRWANWRYEWDGHRWAKMPYHPGGFRAKSNNHATWCSFGEALGAYFANHFDGIHFALGDGWAGIDVDNYQANLHAAWPILDALAGYRETSPSGTGIKIIGHSPRIGGEIKFDPQALKPPAFTIWEGLRFFAITGQDSSGDPTDDISAFIDARFPAHIPPSTTREGYRDAATTSDDDLLLQMVGSDKVGDAILALWRGDLSAYGDDHSRADMALCCYLAWWTNYDAERIDRLFRQSGLMRAHWNDSASYRRATLAKAVR
jgi:putative DNA primase/helicase